MRGGCWAGSKFERGLLPLATPWLTSRRDYRAIDHLDRYESEGLEDDAEEVLDEEGRYAARANADREMDERQRRAGGQLPRALEGGCQRQQPGRTYTLGYLQI